MCPPLLIMALSWEVEIAVRLDDSRLSSSSDVLADKDVADYSNTTTSFHSAIDSTKNR